MEQFQRFLLKYFQQIGGPWANALTALVSQGKLAEAQRLGKPHPAGYRTSQDYGRASLVTGILSKLTLPGDSLARDRATVSDFLLSEHQCWKTNSRLRGLLKREQGESPLSEVDMVWLDVIHHWRQEIKLTLGPLPKMLVPGFSGGSTLSNHGKQTTIPDKLSSRQTVYPGSYSVWAHAIQDIPALQRGLEPVLVRANEFFTVPKDCDKNRACCMEASGSLSLQLAVGSHLKARYRKRYGVDLRTAKPLHMQLAREGSLHGGFATIDLSRASDTMARELIRALLPKDWCCLLESLRATHTSLGGKHVYLEKFSSMGNGFTFELETILFRTLCAILSREESWVFGDDIIVSTSCADVVIAALEYFGFTPNRNKTFCEGPFRESCGGDFFSGWFVRPPHLEEPPSQPQHWVSLANKLERLGLGRTACWWFCVDQVPKDWRNFGPRSLGDLVFADSEAQPTWRRHPETPGMMAPYWRVKRPVGKSFMLGDHFDFRTVAASCGLGVRSRVTVRGAPTGFKTGYVLAYGVNEDAI